MLLVALVLILLTALVVVLWILFFQLLMQNGRIIVRIERLENEANTQQYRDLDPPMPTPEATEPPVQRKQTSPGLPSGSLLPDFELPTLDGNTMRFSQWRGHRVLLIFFDPRSAFCRQMLPALADVQYTRTATLLIVSTGPAEENRTLFERYGIALTVLLQARGEVGELYLVSGMPWAYLVDEQGRTVGEPALGSEAVPALAASLGKQRSAATDASGGTGTLAVSPRVYDGLPAGTPAPYFRLPRLGGGEIALDDYRGGALLLLFPDPAWSPRDSVASELETLSRRPNAPPIAIVCQADAPAIRARIAEQGLTLPIALDHQWNIARDYGTFATPLGYLIDQHGIIAEPVVIGWDAVLALARRTGG